MANLRFEVVAEAFKKRPVEVEAPKVRPSEYFAKYVFNRQKMYKYLPSDVYEKLIDVIDNGNRLDRSIADAVAAGTYTEEELDAIRQLNRKGQFYWDFVFVENSEGAHNSRLTTECLDKAEALIDEALTLIKL